MSANNSFPAIAHITPTTPVGPAIQSWQYYLNDQGRSPHTVKAFIGDLQLLASYFPPDRSLGSISTQDLNHFLQWLQTKRGVPCSPKSLARRITSLKAFFRWLHQGGILTVDPAEKVLQQSVMSPLPMFLTSQEVDRVVEVAQKMRVAKKPDARPFALVSLLLQTGIKKGECLGLSPNHLDFESPNGAFLYVRYPNPRNRYKERKIQLTDEWIEVYQEYQSQYFIADKVFPWSPRRLEYLLEDLGNEANLNKHLSFDMCRWTCALLDWIDGVDPEKIRQKLGISRIQWREISLKLRQLAEFTPG
jgi:site-specific recombinase XerD